MEDDLLIKLQEARIDFARKRAKFLDQKGNRNFFVQQDDARRNVLSLENQLKERNAAEAEELPQVQAITQETQSTNSLLPLIPLAIIGGVMIFG